MSTLDDGQTVGRYRIERFLGAGAMGEVYLARDPHIERSLAIKTVRLVGRPHEVDDRKKRLLREAKAAGRLLHPRIVTLFDTGETDDILYLAFEYVEGSDLSVRMATPPPLSLFQVLRIVEDAADALNYAHQQGIVHRDIKPSNILLDTAGRVKIADFGIAKMAGQSTELTMAGSVMGSPQYLSPEQIRGEELDGRSDIFSLGVVLFELLSGRRPFDGETITTLVYQILHKEPPKVSELRGGIPPRLEQLLARMLAKDRDERYASAGLVAEEIRAIERELPDETLSAPASADLAQGVPTYVLPRRTTAAAPMPPTPPAPRTPATPPTLPTPHAPHALQAQSAPPPLPPVVAAAGRSRTGLGLLLGGLVVVFLAVVGYGVYWSIHYLQTASPPRPESADSPNPTATPEPLSTSPPGSPSTAATPEPSPTPAAPPPTPPVIVGTPTQIGGRPPRATPTPVAPVLPAPAPAPTTARTVPTPEPHASTPPFPAPTSRLQPPPSRPAPAPEPEPEPARPEVNENRKTTLSLAFHVSPPDALVLVDGTVIGRADEWSGLKGVRTYALSDAGAHLIKIRKPGMKEYRIGIEASETNGVTPINVRLGALPAGDVATTDLLSYRVRRAVAFKVEPATTTVTVDGKLVGLAERYRGGIFGHTEWLELAPGVHRITLSAPGFVRRDLSVEAFEGADKERVRIDLNLVSGGGN